MPFEQDLAAGLGEARGALGEEAFRREWLLGVSLPTPTIRAQLAALLAEVSVPT